MEKFFLKKAYDQKSSKYKNYKKIINKLRSKFTFPNPDRLNGFMNIKI